MCPVDVRVERVVGSIVAVNTLATERLLGGNPSRFMGINGVATRQRILSRAEWYFHCLPVLKDDWPGGKTQNRVRRWCCFDCIRQATAKS